MSHGENHHGKKHKQVVHPQELESPPLLHASDENPLWGGQHLNPKDDPPEYHDMEESKHNPLATVISHIVGVPEPGEKEHEVPEGFVLQFDKRQGKPSLIEAENRNISTQRQMWLKEHLNIFSPKRQLGKVFGEGIYLYFDFIRYNTVTNAILFAIMLVNISAHFYYDGFNMYNNEPRIILRNFYVSSYGNETYYWWFWSNIAALIVTFVFGPAFSIRTKARFRKLFGHHDHEDKFKMKKIDVIKDKEGNPLHSSNACLHYIRMCFSYFLFLLILFASTVLAGFINMAQLTVDTGDSTIVYSVAMTAFLLVTNVIWQKVCDLLTKLEGHYTWTSYRRQLTVKFYIWKCANLSVIFISRYIVRVYFNYLLSLFPFFSSYVSNRNIDPCSLNADAEQFFILIVADVTVVRLFTLFWPWFYHRAWIALNPNKAHMSGPTSDKGRPDFDVADEYLDILYRQYLVYLGMSVFPWLPLFGMLGNLIEYPIDKWTLLNISRTPPKLRGSMRTFLTFFMFLTALGGAVMFPQGFAWVLTGFNYKENCPNSIFKNTMDLNGNNNNINNSSTT